MRRYKYQRDCSREWLVDRLRSGRVAVMARSWDPATEGQWVTVCTVCDVESARWLVAGWERRLDALAVIGAHADEVAA